MPRLQILKLFSYIALLSCTARSIAEPPSTQPPQWTRPHLTGSASDSGHFALDESKLRALFPDFAWTADQLAYLREHLDRGDSRAAIVASIRPLVVSAYSDELDAVILVEFPEALQKQYLLTVGDHLIASWVYPKLRQPPVDVVQGPNNLGRHNNGQPIVADFLSDSDEKLKQRKSRMEEKEWARVQELTPAAMKRADGHYRSCFPLKSGIPAMIPAYAR